MYECVYISIEEEMNLYDYAPVFAFVHMYVKICTSQDTFILEGSPA